MIFRSILMIAAGFGLLTFDLGLLIVLPVAVPALWEKNLLLQIIVSALLMSIGPALLITGMVNLIIGVRRESRSDH
jgi:hypothetical protein